MTNKDCNYCKGEWYIDLYYTCPECNSKKEEKIDFKEANPNCRKCWWTGLDWYGWECICRY